MQPQLPDLHEFMQDLRQQLVPIIFESGIMTNAKAVDFEYWGMKAAVATMATAEQVFLPALDAAVGSNKIPGTPAGEGMNSACDHAWFNVTSALGMIPPPIVRGLSDECVVAQAVCRRLCASWVCWHTAMQLRCFGRACFTFLVVLCFRSLHAWLMHCYLLGW